MHARLLILRLVVRRLSHNSQQNLFVSTSELSEPLFLEATVVCGLELSDLELPSFSGPQKSQNLFGQEALIVPCSNLKL